MMKTIDRFHNLAEFRAEKARLHLQKETHLVRLEDHFLAWKKPAFRKAMAKDVISDITHQLLPKGLLGTLLSKVDIGTGISMALGSGRGGAAKRAGLFALGAAAPSLLQKLENISLPEIGEEFKVSWQRLKKHMRERKEERNHK